MKNLIELLKPFIFGQLRHLITIAAGALITAGYLQSSDQAQFIGALMALAAMAWSAAEKFAARKCLIAARAAIPPGALAVNAAGQPIPGAIVVSKVPTAILNHEP